MPAISILTPVYNGLPFIRECVQSVLSQEFQDWELIISDNGSTDGTLDFLKTLSNPQIRVYFQQNNLGIFGNLNFLLQHASSEISFILCADDTFTRSGLSEVVNEWKAVPDDVGLVRFNWTKARFGTGKRITYYLLPKVIIPEDSDFYFFLTGCIQGNLSNTSFRTEALRKAGGFELDLPYAGDYKTWPKLGRTTKSYLSESNVSCVRRHPNVASNYLTKNGQLITERQIVREDLYNRLRSKYSHIHLKLHSIWRVLPMVEMAILALVKRRNAQPFRRLWQALRSPMYVSRFLPFVIYILSAGGRLCPNLTMKLLVRERAKLLNRTNV